MSDYITTYSGIHFVPTEPAEEGIYIKDIAHALSMICRGNGHVKHFFSVGQHCINCAVEAIERGYSRRVCLACLLHDASEAYMSDVPRPFKKTLPEYNNLEKQLLAVIYEKYLGSSLTMEEEQLVKRIDDDMLYFDLKNLLNESPAGKEPEMKSTFSLEYVPFLDVENRYIELFEKLSKTEL